MYKTLATMPRKFKILIMLVSDTFLLPLALWSAVALRHGTARPDISGYWWLFFTVPVCAIPIFIKLGLYRAVIRSVDEKIIKTVILGMSLSVLILISIVLMAKLYNLPRSSIIIYWFLASSYITISRYSARAILKKLERGDRHKQKVAIYGAGSRKGRHCQSCAISFLYESR